MIYHGILMAFSTFYRAQLFGPDGSQFGALCVLNHIWQTHSQCRYARTVSDIAAAGIISAVPEPSH